ncbi:MAG: hypothetical protein HC866_08115 [Leptolyngbyaceae cyanobacterium RU_5_1]|nr:hypothetical protein [Leptolyngbyaceae cyanobacterium RU_5_1]
MFNPPNPLPQPHQATQSPPILNRKAVRYCHIVLPDLPKPVSAILYGGKLYSYVRLYPTLASAQRATERLMVRGNTVVLTEVRKGLIVWVFESDAQPVSPANPRRPTIR